MADDTRADSSATDVFTDLFRTQAETARAFLAPFLPGADLAAAGGEYAEQWQDAARRLQDMWSGLTAEKALETMSSPAFYTDPGQWMSVVDNWYRHMPLANAPFANPDAATRMWQDGLALWENVLAPFGIGPRAGEDAQGLPRTDKRFADPKWRDQPVFALIHQTYLMLSEQILAAADRLDGMDPARKEQLRFATRALVDALSPSNIPFTNPLVLERAIETKGESLVKGMEHLMCDLGRGQLTHTDSSSFEVGRNIAVTPGKVVHETPLYQLIQYAPVTDKVLGTPLIVFPPWINRYYILDLNPKKSFVRWAVEQGVTVFMVSWKSADASMAEVTWDDYVRAQIDAIDAVRARLGVPAVHTVGYCVAGTTLAATLSVLARRGQADKVASATFFTAQVDFEKAGDLKNFVDDQQIAAISRLAPEGYLDGRYMAATFNLLRGNDLIWSYVINNYLMGQDYPAFDMLYWNGDTTNLPIKWHIGYLTDLYRDNRLIVPDSLVVDGTPIDLARIETPLYIQAGREDHIAPPESVWRMTRHVKGPWQFTLAGSGHIAGVVNPPAAKKYQYWTNDGPVDTYEDFVAGATEHPGSWWPHWLGWLRAQAPAEVPATGKRKPGGKGDKVFEDAPGRYVTSR